MKSETALHPRLRGEQRLIERAGQPFGRLAFLGDAGQQPVQVGVGLGQPGERAERVGAAGLLRRRPPRPPQRRGLRLSSAACGVLGCCSCPPAWLMPFWMSAIAEGSAATARLMSVAALSTASSSERAWPSEDSAARIGVDQPHLLAGRALQPAAGVGDVLVGERQPLLGGLDVVGDRS